MIISICGDTSYKKMIINEFKDKYKDKLRMCDYFNIKFNTIIETESMKYKLIDNSSDLNSARLKYAKYVDGIVQLKINNFFESNKDKIILLISDNVLTGDICSTCFFDKSDIKVLLVDNDNNVDNLKYDKSLFDIVIFNQEEIDVRKLVKE